MTGHSDLDESESQGGRQAASRSSRTGFIISRGRRNDEEDETDDEETETDEDETRGDDEGEEEEEVLFYTAQTREEAEAEAEALRQEEEWKKLWGALERLESMCSVLGIQFRKKLLEMGATSVEQFHPDDLQKVYRQLAFLQGTINSNYTKLKSTGKDLLREWDLCDTPFKRMIEFAHVISISDSLSSSDVTDPHFLSTLWLKKAQDEVERLEKDRKKSEKNEYENHKGKLKKIVSENHLAWSEVGYDPQKKVVAERYPQETRELRKNIERAQDLSVGRKELVFRVELVRQLIELKKLSPQQLTEQKNLSPHIIRGHLESAQQHVDKITKEVPVVYDGEDVSTVLDKFKEEIEKLEYEQNKEEEKMQRMQRIRTRHGRSPSA